MSYLYEDGIETVCPYTGEGSFSRYLSPYIRDIDIGEYCNRMNVQFSANRGRRGSVSVKLKGKLL